ncbi:MAG: DUF4430 domain-containing protein [Actinomycetota bacterium]|nr:DUF4430 domain-containing protein [Actinomycetota bacterium]
MRITHDRFPCRTGKGFLLGLVAVMATIGGTVPAHASNVSLTLRVSPGDAASPVPIAQCPVSVPASADGIAVLDAATASHCISGYDTVTYAGYGTFVTCIDGICGQPNAQTPVDGLATFWHMFENKQSTSHGVDAYTAASGDVLEFSYAPSVICFIPC